jgi:outer membrane protein assembly factor BamB
VWKDRYEETVEGVCCGGTLFAPTVKDGILYINVSRNSETAGRGKGPYVMAINAHTGKVIWRSEPVAKEGGAYTNASTVLWDGLLLIGISGPEGGFHNTGGFAILEAKTGKVLRRTHTIPFSQVEDGYGGGSIWTTAVIDEKTGHAFAGTGQPSNPNREHELINAIVKIDMNRGSNSFGEIVDAYKATPDSRTHNTAPCQDGPPETSTATCGYTDVDFGASPTLLKDSRGNTIVVNYQKSGVLHAAYAKTMQKAWEAIFAIVQGPAGNYTSTATDGKQIFGVGTYPGQMFAVDRDWGVYNWASPVGTTIGANPMAYANGVVYHADGKGFLDAYDASNGVPLVHRPMPADVGASCTNLGGGVAIARNTVYSVCGEGSGDASGFLIAYGL